MCEVATHLEGVLCGGDETVRAFRDRLEVSVPLVHMEDLLASPAVHLDAVRVVHRHLTLAHRGAEQSDCPRVGSVQCTGEALDSLPQYSLASLESELTRSCQ